MINAIKVDLIKLLSKLEGLPKDKQVQFNAMLELLKDPNTVISPEERKQVSVFLALIFCGTPQLMAAQNKKLVEAFSKEHLTEKTKTPSPKRQKSK